MFPRAAILIALGCAVALVVAVSACDELAAGATDGRETVRIGGKTFRLDPALDDATRTKGLGGRESIPDDGGMIFVFPIVQPLAFVMRDCVVPIDIAYLDEAGRVLTTHEMKPEEPRREGEDAMAYELRLTQYPSRYPARFVIEVAGGTWQKLGVKPGQVADFDREGLKKRAK